jgi:hypothetical protein
MEDERIRQRPKLIRLSPQPDAARDQGPRGKPPPDEEPSTVESPLIDLTDEALTEVALGEDFPVVVYLRQQLAILRGESDAAREEAESERRRAQQKEMEADRARADQVQLREANRALEKSLREERRRADRLEARLARTLEELKSRRAGSKLAKEASKTGPRSPLSAMRRAFGRGPSTDGDVNPQQIARIESIGKMAYLHKEMMERKGEPLTLGESLELRRIHYGHKVSASASLFGRPDSKAILYRDVPDGTRRSLSDPVRLTEEGEKLAAAYRQRMG